MNRLDRDDKFILGGMVVALIFAILACWVATAGIWRVGNWLYNSTPMHPYSASDTLKAENININQSLPLILGTTVEGSQGSVSGIGALTFMSLDGSWQAASSVRLGLTHGEKSYIMEVPLSKVQFVQKPNANSEAVVVLSQEPVGYYESFTHCDHFWSYGKCWNELRPMQNSSEWAVIQQKGMGSLIQGALVTVTLMVTPEQYNTYLHGTAGK